MNTQLTTMVVVASLAGLFAPVTEAASATQKSDSWTKTYPVTGNAPALEISNIWGDVRVRAGKNNEIIVTVKEVRSAPNQELFERSEEVIKLNIEATSEGVSMVVGDPDRRWNKLNECRGCRVDYQFDVLVPAETVVDVSTVNDGQVDVNGVVGLVSAGNVNGSVTVNQLRDCKKINTVNGPINVTYASAPTGDCEFNTINGDVNLSLPASSNLDVSVDLFNGELASELSVEPLALPAKVEEVSKDGRKKFRIHKQSGFSIGAGGPVYSIKSMNGDIRILKND